VTVVRHIRNCVSVAVVHWGKFHTVFQEFPTRWTAGWLIRSLNRIVFNTHSLSNVCSEWIPDENRVVIQNSVDAETLCTEEEVAEKVQKGPGDPFRVLFLSNMFKEKGYLDVLEAAVRLNREGRNVAFDFVGAWQSGADRKEFEDIVKREHLSDVVQHHGAVSDRNKVRRFHLSADAFALPSYHFAEAQPMSVVEALSAGTPVIVSDTGGIGEMFRDGEEALYVPVCNPDAVRDAVVRLMDKTTWTTMSLHARKLFLETYHPDVVRRRWIDLLTAVRPAAEETD